jgi:hypothetical protein
LDEYIIEIYRLNSIVDAIYRAIILVFIFCNHTNTFQSTQEHVFSFLTSNSFDIVFERDMVKYFLAIKAQFEEIKIDFAKNFSKFCQLI